MSTVPLLRRCILVTCIRIASSNWVLQRRSMRAHVGGTLLVESVVRAVRHAEKCARGIANRVGAAAMRIQTLDRRDSTEKSGSLSGSHIQSQKRNIVRGCAGRLRRNLGAYGTTIRHQPDRSRKMMADRLAVDHQSRDRLAELPGGLAVRVCLALVDLRADCVNRCNQCLAMSGDFLRNLGRRRRSDHPHGKICGDDCKNDRTKNATGDSEELRPGLRAEGQRFLAIIVNIDPEAPDRVKCHHMLHTFPAAWMRSLRVKDFESRLICS